jgi:hypothetical protein
LQALVQHRSSQTALAHWVVVVHPWPLFNLQAPVASHVFMPVHVSGSSAFATVTHAPLALQVVHVPLQEAEQQFWLQKPERHSLFNAQALPAPSGVNSSALAKTPALP